MAKPSSGNTYTLTNWGTGYNLDQFGGYTENGTNVIQWAANSSNTGQHWKYSGNRLYPENSSVVCLDRYIAAGSTFNNADLWKATTTDAAQQILELTETGDGKDLYTITLLNARENGNVLYLTASSTPTGASNQASGKAPGANGNVYWSSTRTANQNYQKWRFSYISGGGSDPGGDEGDVMLGQMISTTGTGFQTPPNPFPKIDPSTNNMNCTFYCWGRTYQKLGVSLNISGNGGQWYNCAANNTFTKRTVEQGPVDNCIVGLQVPGDTRGHVAFVEKVISTNTVYYTEANMGDLPNGQVRKAVIVDVNGVKSFRVFKADGTAYFTMPIYGYIVPKK